MDIFGPFHFSFLRPCHPAVSTRYLLLEAGSQARLKTLAFVTDFTAIQARIKNRCCLPVLRQKSGPLILDSCTQSITIEVPLFPAAVLAPVSLICISLLFGQLAISPVLALSSRMELLKRNAALNQAASLCAVLFSSASVFVSEPLKPGSNSTPVCSRMWIASRTASSSAKNRLSSVLATLNGTHLR